MEKIKIIVAGGGSGGHVTPVIAVVDELQKIYGKNLNVSFWCDKKFYSPVCEMMNKVDCKTSVKKISSGKLRRYNKLSIWVQLMRFRTIVIPNLVDTLKVTFGFVQSVFYMSKNRPDVVFAKGGFVCLPIGIAAGVLKIPLVIHDSDAHPGLTNRILSRFATRIATGAPLEYYPYREEISTYTGIPVSSNLKPMSKKQKSKILLSLGMNVDRPLVVVTGGGLGAVRINQSVVDNFKTLNKKYALILVAGRDQYNELRQKLGEDSDYFRLYGFVSTGMTDILGIADVVVARAGMTTILELAALATPTVLVPNAYLSGGHQLKNAKVYSDADAVEIIDEDILEQKPEILVKMLDKIINSNNLSDKMSKNLYKFAKPNAAKDVADLIVEASKKA